MDYNGSRSKTTIIHNGNASLADVGCTSKTRKYSSRRLFVELSELAKNDALKGKTLITTKIYEKKGTNNHLVKKAKRNRQSHRRHSEPIPTQNLHGISSFRSFQVTSESVMSIKNIMESSVSNDHQTSVTDADIENSVFPGKENVQVPTAKPNIAPRPAILKHRRHSNNTTVKLELEKHLFDAWPCSTPEKSLSASPIKSLAFSPSRFFNTSGPLHGDLSSSCTAVRELSFASTSSDEVEDSGVCCSETEATTPWSPPSLTSTPISSRKRDKLKKRAKTVIWKTPEKINTHDIDEGMHSPPAFQSTPKSPNAAVGKDDSFTSPSISRILNESTPYTPSPFKCPNSISVNEEDSPMKKCSNDTSTASLDSPALRTRRSARKALKLEQEVCTAGMQNVIVSPVCLELTSKCISATPLYNSSSTSISSGQSALIGEKVAVQKFDLRNKSIYRTRSRSAKERKQVHLDKHWVSIACGNSINQRIMTEAAKRCLHRKRTKSMSYFS